MMILIQLNDEDEGDGAEDDDDDHLGRVVQQRCLMKDSVGQLLCRGEPEEPKKTATQNRICTMCA